MNFRQGMGMFLMLLGLMVALVASVEDGDIYGVIIGTGLMVSGAIISSGSESH